MRKLLIGIIVGIVLTVPVVALASRGYPANSSGKLIGGVDCTIVFGNDGKAYPNNCNKDVYRLTDGHNTCYVTNTGAISCLKGN